MAGTLKALTACVPVLKAAPPRKTREWALMASGLDARGIYFELLAPLPIPASEPALYLVRRGLPARRVLVRDLAAAICAAEAQPKPTVTIDTDTEVPSDGR